MLNHTIRKQHKIKHTVLKHTLFKKKKKKNNTNNTLLNRHTILNTHTTKEHTHY